MPSKTKIAKTVVGIVVGLGTSTIVKSIIENNVVPTKKYQIVTIFFGAAVIGMMASDATSKYAETKIDEINNWWTKNVKPQL